MANQIDAEKLLQKLETLPPPARYGVLAGVSLLVVALYFFSFYSGQRTTLTNLEHQLAGLQSKISEAKAIAANIDSFRARGEELRHELAAALARLPNERELPVLLTDISTLGKKAGLEFRGFKPKPEINRDFYAEVPIDIEFYGSYHEAGLFFDRLSRLSRIVNITALHMELESQTGEQPSLKVTGVATTFRFVEQKATDKKADPKKKSKRKASAEPAGA